MLGDPHSQVCPLENRALPLESTLQSSRLAQTSAPLTSAPKFCAPNVPNFWLKEFDALHIHYAQAFNELSQGDQEMPYTVLGYKKKKKALLIEVSVPRDFGLNNTEIKKMTKYQDMKNDPGI